MENDKLIYNLTPITYNLLILKCPRITPGAGSVCLFYYLLSSTHFTLELVWVLAPRSAKELYF